MESTLNLPTQYELSPHDYIVEASWEFCNSQMLIAYGLKLPKYSFFIKGQIL